MKSKWVIVNNFGKVIQLLKRIQLTQQMHSAINVQFLSTKIPIFFPQKTKIATSESKCAVNFIFCVTVTLGRLYKHFVYSKEEEKKT